MASEESAILITGARKGIGRYLAEIYLERGKIVHGCSRSESDLDHPGYTHHEVDVANERDVKQMFSKIRKSGTALEAVLNNAGIASMNHMMLTPTDTFRRILDTNLTGTFLVSREGAKLMRRNKSGRIVNFTTVAVPLELEGESAYAASKAAVVNLTRIAARELAEFGITVNAIGPTPIDTDLIRGVPKEKIGNLIDRQAIKRLGTFDDVVNVVDFFLAPASTFITGQIVYLGGV